MFNPEIVGPAAQHARMLQANATQRSRYAGPGDRGFTRSPPPVDEFRGIEPPFVDVGQGDYTGTVADDENIGMRDWDAIQAQEQRRVKDKTTAPKPEDIAAWMQRRRLAIQKEYDKDIIAFREDEYGATPGGQVPRTKTLGLLEEFAAQEGEAQEVEAPPYTQDLSSGDASIAEEVYERDSRKRASEAATAFISQGGDVGTAMINYNRAVNEGVGGQDSIAKPVKGILTATPEVESFASYPTDEVVTDENKKAATGAAATKVAKGIAEADPEIKTAEAQQTATSSAAQNAERIWDNFSRDSGSKRTKYLSAMNDIYKKMMILNVIAALTGSESQAPLFMEMAMAKMQAMDKFDGMERLDNIRRGVFYTEDGKFDPPKSRLTAFRRAIRFGANEKEATSLSGHHPAPSKTPATFSTWHRMGADGNLEQKTVQTGTRPPSDKGEAWIKGQGAAGALTTQYNKAVEGAIASGNIPLAKKLIARKYMNDGYDKLLGPPTPESLQKYVDVTYPQFSGIVSARATPPALTQVAQPTGQTAQPVAEQAQVGGAGGNAVEMTSQAQYDAAPSGTRYTKPGVFNKDGTPTVFVKP
jgi:hypothetical protein